MNTAQINYLNSLLMILSLCVAWHWPYETFVLAYGYLGPAHYLTQISWLHNRKYFVGSVRDPLIVAAPAVLIAAMPMPPTFFATLTWVAFGGSLSLVITKGFWKRLGVFLGLSLIAFLCSYFPWWMLFFGVMLPTLIHVYLFTGLFILYGALKSRSISGYISAIIFCLCGAIPLLFFPPADGYILSTYYKTAVGPFIRLQTTLLEILKLPSIWNYQVGVMRLIGFAYLYHYLNWFSKTKIIGWHEISWHRGIMITALYLFFIGLYSIDFQYGFVAILFLSIAHVFLEFPLNFYSIKGIIEELRKFFRTEHT